MEYVNKLIDQAVVETGSIKALEIKLGIAKNTLFEVKRNRRGLPIKACIKLAEMTDTDLEKLIAENLTWKKLNEPKTIKGDGMIGIYRMKPIQVEAVQWTGSNCDEVSKFLGHSAPVIVFGKPIKINLGVDQGITDIGIVDVGDYIVHGVQGFYPCQADAFDCIYELVM